MSDLLVIKDLSVCVEGKIVISKISLTVRPKEIHALIGPNGSGKSSLALSLMGHPGYLIKEGKAIISGDNLLSLKPEERAKKGLFLSFQNPITVPNISLSQLVWTAYQKTYGDKKDVSAFYSQLKRQARQLGLKEEMLERSINDGFSGGEKKKAEMLMLLNLNPKVVIFDEIDSGLDIDSLKKITRHTLGLVENNLGIILITHNLKILKEIKPDFIHILKEGRIIESGNFRLVKEIERKGFI